MATQGINIIEQALGAPPISLSNFSVVGVVGTAPGADFGGKFGTEAKDDIAYNTPFYLTKRGDASPADLGTTGTLPLALDSIYAQGAVGVVMVIVDGGDASDRILKDNAAYKTAANKSAFDGLSGSDPIWSIYTDTEKYLAFKNIPAANLIRLKRLLTGQKISIYAVDSQGKQTGNAVKTFTAGADWDDTNNRVQIGTAANTTNLTANDSYSLTLGPMTEAQQKTKAEASALTGIPVFTTVQSILGVKPRLLTSAGIDNGTPAGGSKNPIGAKLEEVAEKLRAVAILDLPNLRSEAVTAAEDYSGDRTLLVSPQAKISKIDADGNASIVNFAMSGFIAGRIAVTDAEQGFWTPVGNKLLKGVLGLAVPVDFEMGNANAGSQVRINAGTMTVVNYGGFRTWGDVSSADGDAEAYKFASVRRIADVLADSVQQNHLWAVSKAIGKNYLSEVAEGVNAFIRSLKAKGALVGGLCYPDGEKNTSEAIANGEAYFNIEFTPVYPASSITFSVQLTKKYLAELG